MRAVVVGADGQLGAALCRLLGPRLVWSGDRAQLDVRDGAAVRATLAAAQPTVIFNASAYNAVDLAEDEPAEALAVNALGPHHLARASAEVDALLVHVSTDFVFDGTAGRPYAESDCPAPLNVYGVSKLAGERLVLASAASALVVRTSAVFGRGGSPAKGGSFVERIVVRARSGDALRVVDDQVVSPTYAPDLATALLRLVALGARGLVHVANTGACSWHALACAAVSAAGLAAHVEPIRTQDLAQRARRPAYSALSNARAAALGLEPLRPWSEALREMFAP